MTSYILKQRFQLKCYHYSFKIICCQKSILFSFYFHYQVTLPIIGQRAYVDPTIYDDPEAALKDFVNEIPAKWLFLERVLGGG